MGLGSGFAGRIAQSESLEASCKGVQHYVALMMIERGTKGSAPKMKYLAND